MKRRTTFLLYGGALGLAGLYLVATSPELRAEIVRVARDAAARIKGCAGCERRRQAIGRMFAQAHEAVNWGRTLGGDGA